MRDTASRRLRLLATLQNRPICSGVELAAELEVSTRTVRTDVDRLRRLGYDIEAGTGTTGGYSLRPGAALPPMTFTDDEALAIAVALHTANTSGIDGAEATDSAAAKLDRILPSRLRHELDTLAGVTDSAATSREPVAPAVFSAVARACHTSSVLRFTYRDRHRGTSERRVEPHRLVNVANRWYLAAYDLDRDAWRSFRLDRIHPRVPTGPRFERREPPESDWATFVTHGRMTALWNYRASIVVEADARTVAARIPTGSWSVEPRTTHTSVLHAGAHNPTLLAAWLAALDLDFIVDPVHSPDLHRATQNLAARYTRASIPGRPSESGQ